MLNDFGQYLADRSARTADVREATITGYEGNGVYDCKITDTGATVFAVALVGMGRLDIGTQCTIAPMAAAGAANAPWRIISADTAKATPPPFIPPASIPTGPSVSRIVANPTILTAGGASVDVVIEGSGLAAGPTYGDPGITDSLAPDVTSTRVAAHVKALATVATGTISTTGTAVVGVGTNFTHFVDGQLFLFSGQTFRISGTPPDDTHLAVDHAPAADVSGVAYSVGYSITAAGTTIGDFFQVIAIPDIPVLLYGNASADGAHDGGTLFKFNSTDNSVTPLYSFDTTVDSAWSPSGSMALVGSVIYFACTSDAGSGFGSIFKFDLGSSTLTLVHAFDGTTGSGPYSGVINVGGKVYGVTNGGGANSAGAAYKIDPAAADAFTVVRDFDPVTDGQHPSGLTYDGTKIYGVTASPGDPSTVFSIDTATDALTVLYAYDATYYGTFGGPNLESANSLDGDTIYIVSQTAGTDGVGAIDRYVVSTNTWTRVIEFTTAGAGGNRPEGPLTKVDPVWYGNASGGGTGGGAGTIFKFDPAGPTLTGAHEFTGADGDSPTRGGLFLIHSKLYIATSAGGAGGIGAIGVLDPASDTYTLLHSLVTAEGDSPFCQLVGA